MSVEAAVFHVVTFPLKAVQPENISFILSTPLVVQVLKSWLKTVAFLNILLQFTPVAVKAQLVIGLLKTEVVVVSSIEEKSVTLLTSQPFID